MAFLPTLCVCENVEWTKRNVVKHGTHPNHQLAAFVTDPVMEIKTNFTLVAQSTSILFLRTSCSCD